MNSSLTPNIKIPDSIKAISKVGYLHKTWARTFTCQPQYFYQPETIKDVVELVKTAKLHHKTLMTVGSGHSPSDLTMTKEWLVNLDKLDHVLDWRPHDSGKYTDVAVEAGVRIYQLNELLDKEGFSLQNLGSIADQSIAGLISTGTHGSTAFHGIVSQQIVDLTLVNGEGEVVKCSQEENEELFRAALLSLGKIGIIVKATIRTVPKFQVKSLQQVITFDELLNNWENIWISAEYIRIWWYPTVGKCVVWRASKTDEQPLSQGSTSAYWKHFGKFFYEFLLYVSTKFYPGLSPFVEKYIFNKQFGHLETFQLEGGKPSKKNNFTIQKSFDAFAMDCLFSQYVNEWAAPLTNGPEVLRLLNHSFQEAAAKKDFFIHVPVEVRCSNNTLSGDLKDLNKNLDNRDPIDIGAVQGNNVHPYLDTAPKLNYVDSVSYLTSKSLSSSATTLSSELQSSTLRNKPSLSKLNQTSSSQVNTVLDTPITNITNSQLTLYLNLVMYRPFHYNSPTGKFFKIFEDVLTAADGKPHWAKNFIGNLNYLPKPLQEDPAIRARAAKDGEMVGFASKVEEWYSDDLHSYKKVRREQDPHGVFLSGKDWAIRNGIVDIDE